MLRVFNACSLNIYDSIGLSKIYECLSTVFLRQEIFMILFMQEEKLISLRYWGVFLLISPRGLEQNHNFAF